MAAPDASFESLIAEARDVDVSGWDFSWLDGRATEERPPWGYAGVLAGALATASASLDLQTGGGEVLATCGRFPAVTVATEGYPPNVARATALLRPRGVAVVAHEEGVPLPFADGAFDLVTSRHPASMDWPEIARVLEPGGRYVAQHVGPSSAVELIEWFLGPQPGAPRWRHPDDEAAAAEAAGLVIDGIERATLRIEILDVGAAVYLLRKLPWWVPDFSVDRYADELRALHDRIRADGVFVSQSSRHLIRAHRA